MSAPANLRERSSGAAELRNSRAARCGAARRGARRRGGRAPLRHQLEVGARLRARELQRGTRQLPARGKAAAGQPMRVGRAERAAGAVAAAAHSVSPAGGSVTRVELMPLSMRAPRSCVDIACGTGSSRAGFCFAKRPLPSAQGQLGRDFDHQPSAIGPQIRYRSANHVRRPVLPLEPAQHWSRGDAKGLHFVVPPAPRSRTSACERCRRR